MSELVAQTVMGQRLWQWRVGDGLRGMRAKWETGFMEASCEKGHESPYWTPPELLDLYEHQLYSFGRILDDPRCLCGVNAYKLTHLFDEYDLTWARGISTGYAAMFSLGRDVQVMDDTLPVLGIVELGGNVHEYERGYRAQYAMLVEGTVLTSLPIDAKALTELEEMYEAPFRVQSYADWKTEWEATYGRDRETETEDQSSETGEETRSSTGRTGSVFSASALNQWVRSGFTLQRVEVDADPVGRKWQPTLTDGRKAYKFGVLEPEWTSRPLPGHKPVLHRSRKAALRKGRAMQAGRWWVRYPRLQILSVGFCIAALVLSVISVIGVLL